MAEVDATDPSVVSDLINQHLTDNATKKKSYGFQPGNKLGKGGSHGGGPPLKREVAALRRAQTTLQKILSAKAIELGETYVALAAGTILKTPEGDLKLSVDPPTTRHAIDKLWPTEKQDPSLTVAIQFNTNVGGREK